ncbi:RagB/SusD family nutrient uptake outer membrane protein [Mongoliitalea daihaiensis]|uniref:RagB/SusD family nutrient uptake outer membrane protein n=1 Tax=Mongoliitalea daihaiensis TaxID=2782006 RepID=UPI001F2BB820|nr:RagB/SusD family nutrient uptake outer membrane protein [Mongoliitalea daihaiensis]UJP64881.1 RagB/SusD family nutrient uptake outer membrane protein [Mongoliitalea daihaiensis]
MNRIKIKMICVIFGSIMISCDSFLDQKPQQTFVIPESLSELQALLDNSDQVFNQTPGGFVFAADEFKITEQGFNAINLVAREFYSWDPEAFIAQENLGDWNRPYQQVFVANLVLEGLERIPANQRNDEWNRIKGQALFCRGFAVFNLVQLFADPYSPSTAGNSFGLPYPTASNINLRYDRETLEITYRKLIDDLLQASDLLPTDTPILTRPSKAAAYLMLAKSYLIISEFQLAEEFASKSYALKNDLLDYNELNPSAARPIPAFNVEQVYYCLQLSISQFSNQIHFDESFINSYDEDDLRKSIFFQLNPSTRLINFKGSYTGNLLSFGGLAVDETIFVLAEAKLRNGNHQEASALVNHLLKFRFKDGEIIPVDFQNESDALKMLFEEKHKQLVFRGTRWTDLRRMMVEGRLTETLSKTVGENVFTLIPREPKWTYLIPFGEVSRNTIPQNPR